jgi:LysR family transcriptional regulator, cell division regulator
MHNIPNPSDLQYFLEVTHTSNLSRAAERLGISQPALSLAMQRLEEAFGVPLLIRSKTGVKTTHSGQRLAQQTRLLLQEWEKIRESATRDQIEVSGNFSIGCHPSVALYSLPGILPELLKRHPRLEVRLAHDLSRRVTEDVISFRLDFGIVVNPVPHPDLVILELCTDEVSLWSVPNADQSTLIFDPDLVQSQSLIKQLTRKGLRFSRQLSSSSLELIASLTAQGVGVGVLPSRVARQKKHPKLQPLPDSPTFSDQVCLVYRADAQKSRSSRAITEAIQTFFKQDA